MDIFHDILQRYWGYPEFRPLQEDIVRSVAEGRDTIGLMPTGGGKSITFQVPAMAMEGICIVVTPLIALMKDQVDNLRKRKIKATAVYSGMSRHEIICQLENCIYGDYKFLYVSPERLGTDIFRAKLTAMNVNLLVVDESHCISQWGYDFRPSYLKIAEIRELIPDVPVLALTATATPDVVTDIQKRLRFREENVFQKSFYRHNLAYYVRRTEDKIGMLVYLLKRVSGSCIVYVRSRKRTKEFAHELNRQGISADFFHAGLRRDEKTRKQNSWKENNCRVIVSTNAFGMGIDKPDVRLVIHVDMPGSLEEYFQEAGRAGRDEKKAFAVALCSGNDSAKLKKRLADEFPDKEFIRQVYDSLGNFLQIAAGYGFEVTREFSLTEFCMNFKLPMLPTHHALKILEMSGYIEYTEDIDRTSRMQFLVTRDGLYKALGQDKLTETVLHVILRSYTGLFSDYVNIDETTIAKQCNTTPQVVYELLMTLSRYKVISYVPAKRTPYIIYTQSREEMKYVSIPRHAYEDRKERFERRINNMLEYMEDDKHCRSRQLLIYFGENKSEDCGICDICRSRKERGLTNEELTTIRDALTQLLDTVPKDIKEITEQMPFPLDKTLSAIRFLVDNDSRFRLKDGRITFIERKNG